MRPQAYANVKNVNHYFRRLPARPVIPCSQGGDGRGRAPGGNRGERQAKRVANPVTFNQQYTRTTRLQIIFLSFVRRPCDTRVFPKKQNKKVATPVRASSCKKTPALPIISPYIPSLRSIVIPHRVPYRKKTKKRKKNARYVPSLKPYHTALLVPPVSSRFV